MRYALLITLWSCAVMATPHGQTPYIYGMHDMPDRALFDAPDNCARGWITELRYIGTDGNCGGGDLDFSQLADAGYGTIMRLDANGSPALPIGAQQIDGYARGFADCIRRSRGVKVWVVGNEPNLPWGHPEGRPYTPQEYGDIYIAVMRAAGELAREHEILFAATAPWAAIPPWGDWDVGLGQSLDHARAQVPIDGVAIHAYTRGHDPAHVTSDARFPGREATWHLHFRGYRDTIGLLTARDLFDLPLYITESGSACDPPCNPYDDQDKGYFVAMYEEIHTWNQANPRHVIRAVTPYRWTRNDDGSGRDFCIGCRNGLRADLQRAIAMGRRWSPTGCGGEVAPEPEPQPAPQPAMEPAPQPAMEPTPQPAMEPTPQPAMEPTPQPVADAAVADARIADMQVVDATLRVDAAPSTDAPADDARLEGGCAQVPGAPGGAGWGWVLAAAVWRRRR